MQTRRPGLYATSLVRAADVAPLRSDVAGFVGRARRGPLGAAVRIETWRDFERIYGGLDSASHLGFAIRGFFENGGAAAHVVRVSRVVPGVRGAPSVARQETAVGVQSAAPFVGAIGVRAATPGAWANGMRATFLYRRALGGSGAVPPTLQIRVFPPGEREELIGPIPLDLRLLAEEPGDPDIDPLPRAVANRSQLIRVSAVSSDLARGIGIPPGRRVEWRVRLESGGDAVATLADYRDALGVLCELPEPALLAFPDVGLDLSQSEATELVRDAIQRSELLKDRLVLAEVPAAGNAFAHPPLDAEQTAIVARSYRADAMPGGGRAAAFYHPWLRVRDPLGGTAAPLRDIPPCGHVAGLISRSDRERGASHTPANLPLFEAVDASRAFSERDEVDLGDAGVNLIRCFRGEGLKVWGGATLARGAEAEFRESRFLAHRRLIHRLVRAIRRVAEPLVFDNNGPELWLAIYRGINSVLFEAFQHGALKGNRPEEGYRIRCDAETNPPELIDLGRVHCEIEIAPASPMEFILLAIALDRDGRLEVFES